MNRKIIVLHDRFSNEPVVIRVDAIVMIRKCKEDVKEYTTIILTGGCYIEIKETIGDVMIKIQKAESEV